MKRRELLGSTLFLSLSFSTNLSNSQPWTLSLANTHTHPTHTHTQTILILAQSISHTHTLCCPHKQTHKFSLSLSHLESWGHGQASNLGGAAWLKKDCELYVGDLISIAFVQHCTYKKKQYWKLVKIKKFKTEWKMKKRIHENKDAIEFDLVK